MFAWRAYPAHRRAAPGAYLTLPALERAGIRAAFTARAGGVSVPPFDSLNLSFLSGDDPEAVRANRARALAAIGSSGWTSGQQVHGARVAQVTASQRGRGAESPATTIPDTDALWTDEPGTALAVLTADCLAVLLVDPGVPRIAVVHVGWRGLVAGLVEAAAGALQEPHRALAFLGPAIGPCCYAVGPEVAAAAEAALGAAVVRDRAEGPRLDLWRGARIALGRAGVSSVYETALCTRCEPDRFFSHRAGHAARQGLIATIAPR